MVKWNIGKVDCAVIPAFCFFSFSSFSSHFMEKEEKTLKKLISTRNQGARCPFAGQNTQILLKLLKVIEHFILKIKKSWMEGRMVVKVV